MAASGAFDFYYAEWSRRLQATGRTDYIVRIGWECNHTFPWFAGADPANYILTHRRIVDFIRLYNPTVTIEWCNTKKGKQAGSVLNLYPGNDWVDIIGVDYYDVSPPLNDQATWDKQYMRLYQGGPWGIGAWLEFAKANGKLFACAEWGIRVGMTPAQQRQPVLYPEDVRVLLDQRPLHRLRELLQPEAGASNGPGHRQSPGRRGLSGALGSPAGLSAQGAVHAAWPGWRAGGPHSPLPVSATKPRAGL